MKKIAIFQMDMGVGGIQKSLLNLLKNLDYSDLSVDLYLFERGSFWEAEFPPEVSVRFLERSSALNKYIPFDAAYCSIAKTLVFPDNVYYDLAIDFNSYQPECAAAAIAVPAARRVEWVHNDIEVKLKNEWKYRILHAFFKGKYKYFDGFVCVSRGIVEPFRRCAGKLSEDVSFSVISNYIDYEEICRKKNEPVTDLTLDPSCFNLVSVGRLCHQKGFDIMLGELKKASEKRENLRLYLIGDGPDRKKLERLSEELGLSEKVFFLGSKSNPFSYMNRMDAFLSTSRYEGQPLNLVEAMAVGLPLICSENLEKYTDGLHGYKNVAEALVSAEKKEKMPNDLKKYNGEIVEGFKNLLHSS